MKTFVLEIWQDLKSTPLWQGAALCFSVIAVYGLMAFNSVVPYDCDLAKGDPTLIFLTHYLMRRMTRGLCAWLLYDYSPTLCWSFGLLLLSVAALLIKVLFSRLRFTGPQAVMGTVIWMSTPFLFSIVLYQHDVPSTMLALCFDALALLWFARHRHDGFAKPRNLLPPVVLLALALGVYQAHGGLLLTAMFGVCLLDPPKRMRGAFADVAWIALILFGGAFVWGVIHFLPPLAAKIAGFAVPRTGGAHDVVAWVLGEGTVGDTLRSLGVGLLLQWGYNAFFIVGLRWVVVALLGGLVAVLVSLGRRRYPVAITCAAFVLSVFALPVLTGYAGDFRTHFSLIPLIAMSVLAALRASERCRWAHCGVWALAALCAASMAHETATLFYFAWKRHHHDEQHMVRIAHDVSARAGQGSDRPVAFLGGIGRMPGNWEDMRPFAWLPLVNHPFPMYSQVTACKNLRSLYVFAKETAGVAWQMPDESARARLSADESLVLSRPAYPQDGYIFEQDGLLVVNLGSPDRTFRRFDASELATPSERMFMDLLGVRRMKKAIFDLTRPFRDLGG